MTVSQPFRALRPYFITIVPSFETEFYVNCSELWDRILYELIPSSTENRINYNCSQLWDNNLSQLFWFQKTIFYLNGSQQWDLISKSRLRLNFGITCTNLLYGQVLNWKMLFNPNTILNENTVSCSWARPIKYFTFLWNTLEDRYGHGHFLDSLGTNTNITIQLLRNFLNKNWYIFLLYSVCCTRKWVEDI